MFYVVIGYDGDDSGAAARRQQVRDQHLERARRWKEDGKLLSAAAFVDDDDNMIGSMMLFKVDSRDEIDRWLDDEPYVTGNVWQQIEVKRVKVPPMFLDTPSR